MTERFLKTREELNIEMGSMPGKESAKKEFAIWLCRSNGPVPSECLQVGMAILRGLDLEKLASDESPPFWAFVGLLEWVNACIPPQEAVSQILTEVRSMYPMSTTSVQGLFKKIGEKRPEIKLAIAKVGVSV